uniref:2'-phosphotransferase n=1 Tax=Mycena chlorophos TaxID=658473 RepID=A0ABQ0LK60_MYCCL|nr:tRNA phosphotransferase 1 [Mycena chlorophos]
MSFLLLRPARVAGQTPAIQLLRIFQRFTHGKTRREREYYWTTRELSFLLRHGAFQQKLPMRPDGYVKVEDLLGHRSIAAHNLDVPTLRRLVDEDNKKRYKLQEEADGLWIRANQGHSMPELVVEMKPILSATEIPMAVHGTNAPAWELIAKQGLSRMSRNHIHLAQGFEGKVISGMRKSASILVFVDVARALVAGIPFFLSFNGVVLTPGNEEGLLEPRFFSDIIYRRTAKHKSATVTDLAQLRRLQRSLLPDLAVNHNRMPLAACVGLSGAETEFLDGPAQRHHIVYN